MNILFVLRTLTIGGVEIVTATLANRFAKESAYVGIFSFEKGDGSLIERLAPEVKLSIGIGFCYSEQNISILRKLLIEQKIDVVVNQWGLPLVPIRSVCQAKKGLPVKVISVFHNDPLQNGRVQKVEMQIQRTNVDIAQKVLKIKKWFFRCVTGCSMRYIYHHSDVFEVLSPSFVSHFHKFTWIKNAPKLVVQTNPVTMDSEGFEYEPENKRKEIIYVGRLDYVQKRVYRVIDIWARLENLFPDWQLTIIGDGEERGNIEHMVRDLELRHVKIDGFQDPRPYYKRASVLILTSEFEGFPLVLAECMSFGVVPVVYGSYPAVYDIIENNKDGVIVPKIITGFNAGSFSDKIKDIINDKQKLRKMALSAIEKSHHYSIETIYNQWRNVLGELK